MNGFYIGRALRGEVSVCPYTGRPLPRNRLFAIYDSRFRELSPEAAREHAPTALVELYDALEAGCGDVSNDRPDIGIAQPVPHDVGKDCSVAWSVYKRSGYPATPRGEYDLAYGLGMGNTQRVIGPSAAARLAPALSAFLDHWFGTPPAPRIETLEEQQAREQQEQAAQAAIDREHEALAAAQAKQQRREQVVADIAAILTLDTQRAETLLQIIQKHFGLNAQ